MANENIGLLSTKDNPFDPFTQWEDWLAYDQNKGYNTCSYLARIAEVAEGLPEEQNRLEIKRAMEKIVLLDPFQNYEIRYKK